MSTNERPAIINERYELGKRIGRGGMADVFLARDRLLDRQVAIKVLFPEFAVDPQLRRALPARGAGGGQPQPPEHRQRLRLGQVRRHVLHRDGVRRGAHPRRHPARRTVTSRRSRPPRSPVRWPAALGFAHSAGAGAPRHQAGEHPHRRHAAQVKVADFGIARAMNSSTESQPHPGRRGDGHGDLLLAASRPRARSPTRAATSTRSAS